MLNEVAETKILTRHPPGCKAASQAFICVSVKANIGKADVKRSGRKQNTRKVQVYKKTNFAL